MKKIILMSLLSFSSLSAYAKASLQDLVFHLRDRPVAQIETTLELDGFLLTAMKPITLIDANKLIKLIEENEIMSCKTEIISFLNNNAMYDRLSRERWIPVEFREDRLYKSRDPYVLHLGNDRNNVATISFPSTQYSSITKDRHITCRGTQLRD